ncbi:AAA domain-containing protein [Aetokthonos hydrillicola Thurmond2011]|jgi:DNA replication protein DnaC|uniref:AAA domain-containing protein n=2 Tax=Aetokthonos TaxID=1550243 RepID=A0AAP5IG27_9CYAN|nr:AAA domain-containing protein [Aetokthonos hydrillicola]MBO3459731.1 AAA family ATPase [Aetokthonos hydrillicola CCALA 1050]MBW4585163.1 AAA family ATPase [Aetokthonos hydrillicola CCALA 1050]MDR9899502.1 AAA domain-containing protein [Aetokthonos hydrillicola Thurmond2011]
MPIFPSDGGSGNWGYKFVNSAIANLITEVEGKAALEAYKNFSDRRTHAEDLMLDLMGEEPCVFYVRRKGLGREADEEIWDLAIATDRDDFQLPVKLKKLGKTLSLLAAISQDGHDGLRLLSIKLLPPARGSIDGYAVPCRLRLLPNHWYHLGVPRAAVQRIASMPICGNHVPTEAQLKAWKAFLQIEENLAQARQFCVPFVTHNYGVGRRVSFDVNVALATLDGSTENLLDCENFWQRVKQAKNEEIKLFETSPTGKNWRNSLQLGSIEEADPEHCIIRVRLERDLAEYMMAGRYQLPATGFLLFEAVGDIQQIRRKKKALDDLNHSRAQNPYLGNFLFDASQARSIQKTVQLQPEQLLLSSANPGQKAAVEKVLAAKDLVLIQGPPGTGKTTVIAEICYQIALRGGRTLIASQANLAVDNALSRLLHNPVIRAVRKGKAEKVSEEGQPFLEDNVIRTWLENTAADCERNLCKKLENVQVLRKLLASSERFAAYLTVEEAFAQDESVLYKRKVTLESTCKEQAKKYDQALAELTEMESQNAALEKLLKTAPTIELQDPKIVKLLDNLLSSSADSSVRNFVADVRLAIALTSKLGLVSPDLGLFGLAIWLQLTVASWIPEVKKILEQGKDAAKAITEAESAAQTHKQNTESLIRLKSHHQKLLTNQQTLQQKINNVSNRKSEIGLAIIDLETWKLTASSNIYSILAKCLEERQCFTTDLISLPSGLCTLSMETQSLPWQQSFYQYQIKVNELIEQYQEWDKISIFARETERLLIEGRNLLGKSYDIESYISKAISRLKVKKLDSTQSIKKLSQLAKRTVDELEKPLSIQESIIEWILATAVKWKPLKFIVKKLRPYSSRFNTAVTLEAIKRQTEVTIERVRPSNTESALSEIAEKIVDSFATTAVTWLYKLQAETGQEQEQFKEKFNQQKQLEANLNTQIATTQEQIEAYSNDAESEITRTLALLQEISQLPQLPHELAVLIQKYVEESSNVLDEIPHFINKIGVWESRIEELKTLIYSIESFRLLSTLKEEMTSKLPGIEKLCKSYKMELIKYQNLLNKIAAELEQESETIKTERNWWLSFWETIPDYLRLIAEPESNLFDIEFLYRIKSAFESWQQQLQKEETFINRYQNFVQDWISKLRNSSGGETTKDVRNDLRRIYLDNANVIGITCVQAANRDFSEEFKYFDVVIIDEVSKCTPPELLIPALKAKKLVMVGDHRQLPPMLDTSTIEEVAQEISTTREELKFLEESLFKSQFESADESIKQMLTTQYRMHPSIMGAINQFYNGKLECGILEPDSKRAHNLTGKIIQEHNHLLWVKIPFGDEFKEQREGTSFFNLREIDVIENLCQEIENTWAPRVAKGESKKEIAVITFYGSQLRKIDERLKSELFPSLNIRTGTVDKFQGMERPVVIVSMVRNNDNKDIGFAKKPERVNVAFSRAQELLIIVGCHNLFTQQIGKVGSMYSEVANVVRYHKGFVDVSRVLC